MPDDLDTDLHFTCFVQAPETEARETETPAGKGGMRLIELDGRRSGPMDRGKCTDLLTVSCLECLLLTSTKLLRSQDVAKIVKEVYVSQSSSMQFSMMYLGPPA